MEALTRQFITRCIALALCHAASPCSHSLAKTYYVSPRGVDSNSGTSLAQPWKSLKRALSSLRPGDTLLVRGGTYTENLGGSSDNFNRGSVSIRPATAAAPITVRAFPGEFPVLVGLLWLNRPSHWSFDGLNVTWRAGNLYKEHMVKLTNGVGWTFKNAHVWGARSFAGILVSSSLSGEPANWRIAGNVIYDIRTEPLHHVNGDHCIYVNTGHLAGAGGGVVEYNLLYDATNGQGVKLGYGRSNPQPGDGALNILVRYNTIYNTLTPLSLADDASGNRFEGNLLQGVRNSASAGIRAYRLTRPDNGFAGNLMFQIARYQYADPGYHSLSDAGKNRLDIDPSLDYIGLGGFRPTRPDAAYFGAYSPTRPTDLN